MEEEICIEDISSDLEGNPFCPHGPTLLFSRKYKDGRRKFYACSACRDRKLCRFFLWADENYSKERKNVWKTERKCFIGGESHKEIYSSVHNLKPYILKHQVAFCHTCSKFIIKYDLNKHVDHRLSSDVTMSTLRYPTELLKPLECDKKEAQYFFSKMSASAIINIAQKNKIKSVICVGAPRIHEYIKTSVITMDSILLDFDRRYHMFYKPQEFCWFNSFNNYFFFGNESKQNFIKFILKKNSEDSLIILDPPFGGRLEPLSCTLQSIQELHKKLHPHQEGDIPVFLIYPYFMEQHIVSCLPTFKMVDYKVTYDNHSLFSSGQKSKKLGSPVRIFTNMPLNKIILPIEEGYNFCTKCSRWVCAENKHCQFCDNCTSKNGSTYTHCFKCKLCVKPSWKHCYKCGRCCQESHNCEDFESSVNCHNCGEEGHKQQNCVKYRASNAEQVLNITDHCKRKWSAKTNKLKKKCKT